MIAIKKVRSNFTLIELLVVIAIIGILATLLFPSLQKARLAAKTALSINNLKQIHIGTVSYSDDHNEFLFLAANNPTPSSPDANWRTPVFEHIGNEPIPAADPKEFMDRGVYKGIMYCPVILGDRGGYPEAHKEGRGHYGMNQFFGKRPGDPANDYSSKGYKSMSFAAATADEEPLYMATKTMNSGSSGFILDKGSMTSNNKNSPEYIYSKFQSLACFLDGSVMPKSASWGSFADPLISNENDFK